MERQPINPYESPREANLPLLSPRKELIARLRGPSIGLLVMSGLHMAAAFINLATMAIFLYLYVTRSRWIGPSDLPQEVATSALFFAPSAFIFFGAWQMRRMRYLTICRTAAIMACIPFLTPMIVLGIPLGIWAAVVLFQKSTAEEFGRTIDEPSGV